MRYQIGPTTTMEFGENGQLIIERKGKSIVYTKEQAKQLKALLDALGDDLPENGALYLGSQGQMFFTSPLED